MTPPHPIQSVFLHVSSNPAPLAACLSDAGFRVVSPTCRLTPPLPRVAISDSGLPESDARLTHALKNGNLVVISLGDVLTGSQHVRHNIELPPQVDHDELIRTVRLAARMAELSATVDHEQRECRRWVQLAMHDPLTSLPNRRRWEQRLSECLASRIPICVGVIDVDHFKRINDADGYLVGDDVLRKVGTSIRSQLRHDDLVARLGGDEFGVIIPHVNAPVAEQIMERLRHSASRRLRATSLPSPTLSAGFVTAGPNDARDRNAILDAATLSLQAAKRMNRNRTVGGVVGLRTGFRKKTR